MLTHDVFILGATGFVGSAVVDAALRAGLKVGAWARSEAQAGVLRLRGVAVSAPPSIPAAKVVIDLIQPKLPERLSEAALVEAARYRVETTRGVLRALPRRGAPVLGERHRRLRARRRQPPLALHRRPEGLRAHRPRRARRGARRRCDPSPRSTSARSTARASRSRRRCFPGWRRAVCPSSATARTGCR